MAKTATVQLSTLTVPPEGSAEVPDGWVVVNGWKLSDDSLYLIIRKEREPKVPHESGSAEGYLDRIEVLEAEVASLRVATTTVEEWEACHKITHPDPEGFRKAAVEQGKRYLATLGGR